MKERSGKVLCEVKPMIIMAARTPHGTPVTIYVIEARWLAWKTPLPLGQHTNLTMAITVLHPFIVKQNW
jgi:hypothetical protein